MRASISNHAPSALRHLLWPHVLGFDAALIAVLWQEIGAKNIPISISSAERIVLFCIVWGIYLCDRVWDVKRLPASELPSIRHQVARRLTPIFILLAGANFLTAGILAIRFLNFRIWMAGCVLSCFCGIYYTLHATSKNGGTALWRALLLGAIFAGGCLSIPFIQKSAALGAMLILYFSLSLILASNAHACMQAEAGKIDLNILKQNPLMLPALVFSLAYALTTRSYCPLLAVTALGIVLLQRPRLNADVFAALCDASLLIPIVLLF